MPPPSLSSSTSGTSTPSPLPEFLNDLAEITKLHENEVAEGVSELVQFAPHPHLWDPHLKKWCKPLHELSEDDLKAAQELMAYVDYMFQWDENDSCTGVVLFLYFGLEGVGEIQGYWIEIDLEIGGMEEFLCRKVFEVEDGRWQLNRADWLKKQDVGMEGSVAGKSFASRRGRRRSGSPEERKSRSRTRRGSKDWVEVQSWL